MLVTPMYNYFGYLLDGSNWNLGPEGLPTRLFQHVEYTLVALVIAGLTILFPPLGYVALAAFVVLLLRAQRGGERKYEGLRILR